MGCDDAKVKVEESRRWTGVHGAFAVESQARGVVVLKISGHDIGEFGQAPMREMERYLIDGNKIYLFVDARSTETVSVDVSGDWAQWLGARRSYWAQIHMLTGSRFVQVTAGFVRRFAELGSTMKIYTKAEEFDRALAEARDRAGSA